MENFENINPRCLSQCQSCDVCNTTANVMNCVTNTSNYLNNTNTFDNISINNNNDSLSKSVIIYESISSDSNNDDSYNYINNNSIHYNIDPTIDSDINEYERKIKLVSAENQTLNQQLIRLEEQIIDLIDDKKELEKSVKSQKEYYSNKIDLYQLNIKDLTENIESLEKTNIKLEQNLNQKIKEKTNLELRIEEIEDKLLYCQFELSEVQKNEAELRMSLKAAKDALVAEERNKHEAISQLHQLYLQCSSHENQISGLKQQVDVLKKQITDKDNELWFFRSGNPTSVGHDIDVDLKTPSNRSSSIINNKLNHSDSGKSSIFSVSSEMDEPLYEKLSDLKDKECLSCENQTNGSDNQKVQISEEEAKVSNCFPSLPDVILRKLQLLRESCCSIETLTEQEIESKFTTLSLGFKTDKFTLEQRLHLQKHQRDVAEQDALNELQSLRDSVQQLNQMIFSSDEILASNMRSEVKDLLNKIETQVEVVGQTNAKISSRSELYGAVKQEERVSNAFDVILIHAENLKRSKERDQKELEETKKLLINSGYKKNECDSDSDNDSHHMRRSVRSISTTVIPKMNLIRVRRASVSSIEILPSSDTHRRSVQHSSNGSSRYVPANSNLLSRSRRRSMPASPSLYRSRLGADAEMSQLEITTEERGGSESDYASSVANQESDDEQSTHNILYKRKLSEEEVMNALNASLVVSEPTADTSLKSINNNIETESFSHSFSHESGIDNSCDEQTNESTNSKIDANKFESHKSIASIVEYKQLANL